MQRNGRGDDEHPPRELAKLCGDCVRVSRPIAPIESCWATDASLKASATRPASPMPATSATAFPVRLHKRTRPTPHQL